MSGIRAISVRRTPALEAGSAGNGTVEVETHAARPHVAAPKDALLPGNGSGTRLAKRVFDLLFASLILILASPLLLVIALIIKLDSRGPVFFRSHRVGRNGLPFEMLKFRTMIDGAHDHRESLRELNEAGHGLFKVTSDPRTTRVGRALRTTCLDELPQLFHVLTGKMSLVGPRPLVPEESGLIPSSSPRFSARPGITGPWQLAGSWQVPIPEMVELDSGYLDDWSLWLDVKLLTRTMAYAIARGGV
jgi:lipopolysaccharide/colanic/teichoic acid biosynthesis glycosyltransferase